MLHSGLSGLLLATLLGACTTAQTAPSTKSPLSVSPFPYDLTPEAVRRVTSLVQSHGDLYTVQLDNGIPWAEALSGAPFPPALQDQWKRHKDSIASHHQVYVAIAPLAEDRTSWAETYGGVAAPRWAKVENRLTDELKTAYRKYVLRVVEYFQPTYLNIGVESGDMAAKLPSKWPLFETLYIATAEAVADQYPAVKIGISSGLPFLQMPGVMDRAKRLFDRCDYIGISFYPYMSEFYEKFGAAPLPPPPDQWRQPLEWLRRQTDKPIAICETGYSSEPVRLPKFKLSLSGDPANQARYTEDLARIAVQDRYLFTVFFLAMDYDALMNKMLPGDETPRLWGRTGFFGTNGVAKPAWRSFRTAWFNAPPAEPKEWKESRETRSAGNPVPPSAPASGASGASASPGTAPASASASAGTLGFASDQDLFVAPSPDEVTLESATGTDAFSFMRWKYRYRTGQFVWAVKTLAGGAAAGTQGLEFQLRSDRTEPLLVQIEEADGEAFYTVVNPSSNWTRLKLPWTEFKVDAGKRRNGKVDAARLVRITLADGAATDRKATGARTVEAARMGFLRPETSRSDR